MASKSVARKALIQPRFMRAGEAPEYLSMNLALFNEIVRPYVSEFPLGERGVGFDRLELDEWASPCSPWLLVYPDSRFEAHVWSTTASSRCNRGRPKGIAWTQER